VNSLNCCVSPFASVNTPKEMEGACDRGLSAIEGVWNIAEKDWTEYKADNESVPTLGYKSLMVQDWSLNVLKKSVEENCTPPSISTVAFALMSGGHFKGHVPMEEIVEAAYDGIRYWIENSPGRFGGLELGVKKIYVVAKSGNPEEREAGFLSEQEAAMTQFIENANKSSNSAE